MTNCGRWLSAQAALRIHATCRNWPFQLVPTHENAAHHHAVLTSQRRAGIREGHRTQESNRAEVSSADGLETSRTLAAQRRAVLRYM